MNRLFVYGSLQPGAPNEHMLEPLGGEWQPATVRGRLVRGGWGVDLGFPGLVLDDQAQAVRGQLLSSPRINSLLPELDRFEGDGYQRVTTPVLLDNGESVEAWIYTLRRDKAT
jgi:gamma-glutamylcyclotransferase (GGCT)/AIG2-like uncharacterized protein YtfP